MANNAHRTFHDLGITKELLGVLDTLKFKIPTPIQEKAVRAALAGKDILGIAQTGTGKTLAFGIPIIEHLLKESGRALILVPTRELALQIDQTMRKLANPFNIRSVIVIGGMDMDTQSLLLKKENIRIIIATPGRLLDHVEQRTLKTEDLKILVLDEADRMLDMGFGPQIEHLAKSFPKQRQSILFSATMPEEIVKLAALYTQSPVRIEAAPSGAAPEKIHQEVHLVSPAQKLGLLETLLQKTRGRVLIFTRTKAGTWRLAQSIKNMGYTVNELHSDRDQGQRRHALEGFKSGLYQILVATDIAARGIHVEDIELVVNFDLPEETENYVHRIGRTGRAGQSGRAVTFASPYEEKKLRAIEKLMKQPLNIISRSGSVTAERPTRPQSKRDPKHRR